MNMKGKVLLIEDDLLAARAYQKLLENANLQVDCALDGHEGLEKSRQGYHCIILDLALPKLDGWQVLERLKKDDGLKHIPVIICTVLDGEDHRKKATELGAQAFVNKFKDNLLDEVKNALSFGEISGRD